MKRLMTLVTLVVLVVAGVVLWPHLKKDFSTSASSVTTTTTQPSYVAPLSGLPDPSGSSKTRPAMTVKVENTPDALPQWGVDQADVVYEEIVNGGITRLAAIFNSQVPTKIGPVRSVRPTDTQVVWPIGGLFVYSGGAQYAVNSIETAPVKLIDESSAGSAMYRDPNLEAPHNLFASGPGLFAFGGTPTPPPALFQYSTKKLSKSDAEVSSFVVGFPSIYPVTWTWDTATQSWDRTLFGKPDVTGTGVRESPKTVVVMFVNYYGELGADNSYADLQGSGKVEVFEQGREITGTWSRGPSKSDIIQYTTSAGKTLTMTPGQTWVELADVGESVTTTK
jgi:Protein of unknown function (DUF3048) N-terminal domain/Protein of unknown function (DUF3048) C-terminal domain